MAGTSGRRVRSAPVVGVAVGIVLLTATGALALGHRSGTATEDSAPPGRAQSAWARDHHGPPPWAHGRGRSDQPDGDTDRDDGPGKGHSRGPGKGSGKGHGTDHATHRHGPPPWAHGKARGHARHDAGKAAKSAEKAARKDAADRDG